MLTEKAFYRILKNLSHSPHKAEKYLTDTNLSQAEKKIIEAHLEIRNNRNEYVISMISKMPPSEITFVEAQRNLVLGVAYNNCSRFIEAEQLLVTAAKILRSVDAPHFLFTAEFNLFILAHNTHNMELMRNSLDAMKSLHRVDTTQEARFLRCQFLYQAEIGNLDEAREYLTLVRLKKHLMPESDLISHLVAEFMFHIHLDEFEAAKINLDEMKKHRKFHLSENFKFMKTLLMHLLEDAPIYIYEDDIKGIPILHHQLEVIQALETNDLKRAQTHWDSLTLLQKEIYLPDFHYRGRKGLFSLCLAKHRKSNPLPTLDVNIKKATLAATLIELLKAAEGGLPKEKIYQILYGQAPDGKDDLQRLSRLVSRVRSDTGLNIQTRKGNYFLKTTPKAHKAS